MNIVLNDDELQSIIKEETDKAVRKRIKEMQGDYTSKCYLERIIYNALWDMILKKIPTIDDFLQSKIDYIVSCYDRECKEIKKSEIVNKILDSLMD